MVCTSTTPQSNLKHYLLTFYNSLSFYSSPQGNSYRQSFFFQKSYLITYQNIRSSRYLHALIYVYKGTLGHKIRARPKPTLQFFDSQIHQPTLLSILNLKFSFNSQFKKIKQNGVGMTELCLHQVKHNLKHTRSFKPCNVLRCRVHNAICQYQSTSTRTRSM